MEFTLLYWLQGLHAPWLDQVMAALHFWGMQAGFGLCWEPYCFAQGKPEPGGWQCFYPC